MLRLNPRIYFLSALVLLQAFSLCNFRIRNGKVCFSHGLRCWTWFSIGFSIVATSLNIFYGLFGFYQTADAMIIIWDICCTIFCAFFIINFCRHQKILRLLILNFLKLKLHPKFTEGNRIFIHVSMFILFLIVLTFSIYIHFTYYDSSSGVLETIVKIFVLEFVFPLNHVAFTFFYVCMDICTDHLLQCRVFNFSFQNRFYCGATRPLTPIDQNKRILNSAELLQIESILTMLMDMMEGNLLLMTGLYCVTSLTSIYLLVVGVLSSGHLEVLFFYALFTSYVDLTSFLIASKCDHYNTEVSYA